MGPKAKHPENGNLFQRELVDQINMEHPLVKLVELIEWQEIAACLTVLRVSYLTCHAWQALVGRRR